MHFAHTYIESAQFEFHRYKTLGDTTFSQLSEYELHWRPAETDNSIAIIIKHLAGNMLSRWTNFLIEDGEKSWRRRDDEFENPPQTKQELITLWEKGWACLFQALDAINTSNFDSKVKIRGEEHTIEQAVNRQLAHYAYHTGQIVLMGKMIKGVDWQSLSIPKGGSKAFNEKVFGKE